MASWNKKVNSPVPPIEKDMKLVSSKKKTKTYPSEKNRTTTKVFKRTDDIVSDIKDSNRYPKIEIYEKAIDIYKMIDDVIPEYSNISKEEVVRKFLEEYKNKN